MSPLGRFRTQVALVVIMCAAIAQAQAPPQWTVAAETQSAVESNKHYPNLIRISVKQSGNNAPVGTTVAVERVKGDAQLMDNGTAKSNVDITIQANDGTTFASVLMGSEPAATFLVSVIDPADATKRVARDTVELNAFDFIPGGVRLGCFKKREDRRPDEVPSDCREDDTYFTFYSGYAVNNFAVPALSGRSENDSATSSDIIAGLDFGHAIFRRDKTNRTGLGRGELWVYGETLHGVASTNNCDDGDGNDESSDVCPTDDGDDGGSDLTGVIQSATTLEAYVGLRYEFQILPLLDETGSRLYAKAQAGFISLLGKGLDVVDNHHGGLGIVKVHGRFTDSYLEAGYGRNDLFKVRSNGRWKVDGLVTINTKWPDTAMIRPFIQFTADTDFGSGEDSVQTFFGLDFDLTLLKIFSVPSNDD